MLALVVLGLVACESVASFKFNKVTGSHDRGIYYPNRSSNNYDYKPVDLNEQKKYIHGKKENLDRKLKNIYRQNENLDRDIETFDRKKEYLDREIEIIDRKKEYLDREIEKLNRQKNQLNREIDIIYEKKKNFDKNINYLNRQKDHLDNEIEKIDLEIEKHDTYIDRDRYKVHRAAVEDNEYRITINLPGYNENEIVIKTGRGLLVVQAVRDVFGEPKKTFQNIRSLPDFVTENGSWSYKWDVLRIVFPVKRHTKYETNNVVNQNGVIGKDELEKKYTTSRTVDVKIPIKNYDVETTTYVSNQDYDVDATTQVTIQKDDVGSNYDGKIEVGELKTTTQVMSQWDDVGANIDGKNAESELKAVTNFLNQGIGMEATTYLPNQRDVETTVSYSNQEVDVEAKTYFATANDDVKIIPVKY